MSDQTTLELFPNKVTALGKHQYLIKLFGQEITVKWEPNWSYHKFSDTDIYATQHFEFTSDGPNLISETGYRSCFVNGTIEELGLTDDTILDYIQSLAESLCDRKVRR